MAEQLKEIEIPFGAKDSELCGWEYTIPEGMEATIVDNKIIVKKKESEDEKIRKWLIGYFNQYIIDDMPQVFGNGLNVKDVLAWLEKQGEQKPIDNVEPKFREGDFIVNKKNGNAYKVVDVRDVIEKEYHLIRLNDNGFVQASVSVVDKQSRLWDITKDAKDGDVLACPLQKGYEAGEQIFIFKRINSRRFVDNCIEYYCRVCKGDFYKNEKCYMGTTSSTLYPATQEQRDFLFQKMHEAGYEWDTEKKELRKIEQKTVQEIEPFEAEHDKYYYCIKDYFCGGKKQASKGDVVQALRGLPIMCLKDASEYFLPVNSIKCNSNWSEEDEEIRKDIENLIHFALRDGSAVSPAANTTKEEAISWIQSLKERIQPQPKQEWSDEDEEMYKEVLTDIIYAKNDMKAKECLGLSKRAMKAFNWFSKRYKSLRPQNTWKPSDEQLVYLSAVVEESNENPVLDSLYQELKKLKGE